MDTLACQWRHFSDPHSSLLHYSVAFGSTKGAQDILSFHNVGMLTSELVLYYVVLYYDNKLSTFLSLS